MLLCLFGGHVVVNTLLRDSFSRRVALFVARNQSLFGRGLVGYKTLRTVRGKTQWLMHLYRRMRLYLSKMCGVVNAGRGVTISIGGCTPALPVMD